MRLLLLSCALALTGCSDDAPAPIDAAVAGSDRDAATCQLSGGCDFIVSEASECPDPANDPTFCDGVCAGVECCYCEGTEAKTLFVDCIDGCPDAGP